jgi:hypothetical protein
LPAVLLNLPAATDAIMSDDAPAVPDAAPVTLPKQTQATWHDGRLWLWGFGGDADRAQQLTVFLPEGETSVAADALAGRAMLEALEPDAAASDSHACLARLLAFARSAVTLEQFYPSARRTRAGVTASWRILVGDPQDVERLEIYAAAMPAACFCADEGPGRAVDRLELVESFLDACCDAVVREAMALDEFFAGVHAKAEVEDADAEVRWVSSLVADPDEAAQDTSRRHVRGRESEVAELLDKVQKWTARLGDSGGEPWRLGFVLHEPENAVEDDLSPQEPVEVKVVEDEDDEDFYADSIEDVHTDATIATSENDAWPLTFRLLPPSELADQHAPLEAEQVWDQPAGSIGYVGRNAVRLRERLGAELARAAEFLPSLQQRLLPSRPTRPGDPIPPQPKLPGITLTSTEAFRLMRDQAEQLTEQGFDVRLPEWAGSRDNRLEVVMDLRPANGDESFSSSSRIGLDAMLAFDWRIAVGGEGVTAEEFRRLVQQGRPLVRRGGQWVEVDLEAAAAADELIRRRPPGEVTLGEAFRAGFGLGEFRTAGGVAPAIRLAGMKWVDDLLEQSPGKADAIPQPPTFQGELRPYQLRGLQWLAFLDRLGLGGVLADDMGLGKAQPLDAKILTPTGWTTIGELAVGQAVVGSDGTPTKVTGVFPQGELEVFRVTFSDGASVECCDEHLWHVNTPTRKHRGLPGRTLPLKEIRSNLRDAAGNCRHFIPLVEPVTFEATKELPIDSYVLGVLLGDGGLKHRAILSSADDELVAYVAARLPQGVQPVHTGSGVDYRLAGDGPGKPNPLLDALDSLGLRGKGSAEKFVPDVYLHASPDDRLELLRGILDSDGHVRPADNHVELTTASTALAEGVTHLVRSLGGTTRSRTKTTTHLDAIRLTIAMPGDINPFRLSRKAETYRPREKYPPSRAIVSVEAVGSKPCQCISVAADDQLYVTDDFVITHNTIQLIALLLDENERREADAAEGKERPRTPTLLFVPTSVLGNWGRELARFAPQLKVLPHHGTARLKGEAFAKKASDSDVVVTSYALSHRDRDEFGRVAWGRVALDEAQKVKNPAAASSVAVRELAAPRRVALTGTPVENHLGELWSIMDLLNPGLLGTQGEFRERFAIPIEKHGDRGRARRLREMIRPFVLRRTKDEPEVAADLPAKMEMPVFCGLTAEQAAAYERITSDMLGRIDTASGIRRRGLILSVLTKLKQICDHPALLAEEGEKVVPPLKQIVRSGKATRLAEMLEEVIEEGERALVFTQYRKMGDLLVSMLEKRLGRDVYFLHGGTPQHKREEMVLDFQADHARDKGVPVFILSLRAGGLGLNLTAASHVFHYDRWWNPAVENQATDRAHRIGQTRRVQVHKFVTLGTVEERIDKMLLEKTALAQNIVGSGDEWLTELSTGELKEYLSLSRGEGGADDLDEDDVDGEMLGEAVSPGAALAREAAA